MSKSNSKLSNFAQGTVTNITKDDALKALTVTFNVDVSSDNFVIYKNSILLRNAFEANRVIRVKELKFKNLSNVTQSHVNLDFIVKSSYFENVSNIKHAFVTCKWKPLNYSSISSTFSFSSSTENNVVFSKIGALKNKNNSGYSTKSFKQSINTKSYQIGTLPASKITTGRTLQSFNDPYIEKNLIRFIQKSNVNIPLGLPIVETSQDNGFYITTDSLSSPFLLTDNRYQEQFDLKNSKIIKNNLDISSDNIKSELNIDSEFVSSKTVTSKDLDNLIIQKRFKEEFVPFKENNYYFEELASRSEFYSDTLDKDIEKNYDLGKQKQIKITLDFSGGNHNDLHLLNTKFSFIYPNTSQLESNFTSSSNRDEIYDTQFFNFIKGNKAESFSSHHMPTVYWNNTQNRWSYLDAGTDDVNYLGSKIPTTTSEKQIQKNFIFNSSNNLETQSINTSRYRNFNALYYNKPVLTTPGFRNDGSLLESNQSNENNKSMLSQITDTYGFPYKANWQPTNDHLIDMSQYLAKDFLLEKMIIKGKYTSKGEMPATKGNFSSGYEQSGNVIGSLNDFQSTYDLKDNNTSYVSNAVTFFLLNEQENQNYLSQDIKIEPIQHYTFLKTDNVDSGTFGFSFGKELKSYNSEFKTYEQYSNTLNVKSYILENNSFYTFDAYNVITANSKNITEFSKNRFYYLDSSSSNDVNKIDNLYYKSRSSWDNSNFSELLNSSSSNIYAKIKKESQNDFNQNKSRELVTYSNMLITKKNASSGDLDNRLLENIDLHEISTTNSNNEMHIHQETPKDFEIRSFCKNNSVFSDYTDESEIKIKSNYFKKVISQNPTESKFDLKLDHPNADAQGNFTIFTTKSNPSNVASILSNITNYTSLADIYFSLKLREFNNNTVKEFLRVYFSYGDPSTLNGGSGAYNLYNASSSNTGVIYLKDFVSYSKVTVNGFPVNKIVINLRYLDVFQTAGSIVDKFLVASLVSSNLYNITSKAILDLKINNNLTWNSFTPKQGSLALTLLIAHAIFNKGSLRRSTSTSPPAFDYFDPFDSNGVETLNLKNDILNLSNNLIKIKSSTTFTSPPIRSHAIEIVESTETTKKYTFLDQNGNVLLDEIPNSTAVQSNFSIPANSIIQGLDPIKNNENYFNSSYILEGKNLGNNNIELPSNRIVNKKNISENVIPEFKTKSGKIIQEGNAKNNVVKSNYILKPSDNLVFGVSSNCNGQVMPTVFKLHNKLEITLIGRDFIDNSIEYKNNQSKSIRKVVIGDNYIKKSGDMIYETKGSYFDNIWSKSSLKNSLEDFKENKTIIEYNSSREKGTYSGIVTLERENILINNNEVIIFNKDTVHPSIGKIFKDVNLLNLTEIESDNHFGEKEIKLILSENFESINNSLNVINKWHKTFHLDTFSVFFNNEENIVLDEKTESSIENKNLNIGIYYDIDSYKPSSSLKEFSSYVESNFITYDNQNYSSSQKSTLKTRIRNACKNLKEFVLPSSLLKSYQNGIQIKNEESFKTYENGFLKNSKHIKSDVNLQKINNINKIYVNKFTSSLQYFDSFLNISQNIADADLSYEITNINSKINRKTMSEYVNDMEESTGNFDNFNPQWHLVVEIPLVKFNALVENNDGALNYLNKNLNIFLFEDENDVAPVSKSAIVIRVTSTTATLAIPLYFWETMEIDTPTYFNTLNSDRIVYGKVNNPEHDATYLEPAWYAKLQTGSNTEVEAKKFTGIYSPFVNSSEVAGLETYSPSSIPITYSHPTFDPLVNTFEANKNGITNGQFTKIPFTLPYTISALSSLSTNSAGAVYDSNNAKDKLILARTFLVSLNKFETLDELNPTYIYSGQNKSNLNNFYKLEENKRYFIHEKYFENNQTEIDARKENGLDKSDSLENIHLNEKLYRSKIYKKSINGDFLPTKNYLIYKIHTMYTKPTSSDYEYNIVEIIAADTDSLLFESKKLNNNYNLFNIEKTDTIRVYEDDLLKHNYFNKDVNINTPYFEINFDSKVKSFGIGSSVTVSNVNQIINSYLTLDSSLDISTSLTSQKAGKTGTPIFVIKNENKSEYKNFNTQEEAIKNFFYGFSRGKYRYPIEKLDGFKYGVQTASPQTLKLHFSNKRFGNLSDKIMGSKNYATIFKGKSDKNFVRYNITKTFVDENYRFIASSTPTQYTYNTDKHSRCTKPFVEVSV